MLQYHIVLFFHITIHWYELRCSSTTTILINYSTYLYSKAENVLRMYSTPKIQKPDSPLRPIVDYTGSIGCNVSRSLADLLAPIVGKTSYHIKNSKHLANKMASIMIEQDEIFLSHDVVSPTPRSTRHWNTPRNN